MLEGVLFDQLSTHSCLSVARWSISHVPPGLTWVYFLQARWNCPWCLATLAMRRSRACRSAVGAADLSGVMASAMACRGKQVGSVRPLVQSSWVLVGMLVKD